MAIRRGLGQGRQIGRLSGGQFGQGFVEIGLGGGSHAIGILAQKDFIQIKLEDLLFAHHLFDPDRQNNLFDLAFKRPGSVQQKVLHHLLRDGRGPAQIPATRGSRAVNSGQNPARIKPAMFVEILVFSRYERLFDQIGNFISRRKQPPFGGKFINDLPLARINPADRLGRILRQNLVRRQIAPVDV